MDSKMKKLVAGVALAGALTVGTAGVAVAAEGSGATTDPVGRRPRAVTRGCVTSSARPRSASSPTRSASAARSCGRPSKAVRPSASTPPRWARTPRPWSTR